MCGCFGGGVGARCGVGGKGGCSVLSSMLRMVLLMGVYVCAVFDVM